MASTVEVVLKENLGHLGSIGEVVRVLSDLSLVVALHHDTRRLLGSTVTDHHAAAAVQITLDLVHRPRKFGKALDGLFLGDFHVHNHLGIADEVSCQFG